MKPLNNFSKALLIFLAMFWLAQCDAQTYPVPTVILDGLIFETMKGRECSRVLELKNVAIQKQGNALLTADSLIKVKDLIIENKDFIIGTWQTDYFATVQRLKLEKQAIEKSLETWKAISYLSGGAAIGSPFGLPGVAVGLIGGGVVYVSIRVYNKIFRNR